MMKSAYPFSLTTAIILSVFILSGCSGGGKKDTLHISQQTEEEAKASAQLKIDMALADSFQPTIDNLVEEARLENPETTALNKLLSLSKDISIPRLSQGRAALQYAELLFEFERPDAFTIGKKMLKQWPNHPYARQTHLFLANQWALLEYNEEAINELTLALTPSIIEEDILKNIIEAGQTLLSKVSDQSSITWMLAVSKHDIEKRDYWLNQAARHASLEFVLQLRQSKHALQLNQANFYRYVARERLMVGDYHAVRLIAKILNADMPDSEAKTVVQKWAISEGEATTIGVLLPLSGKYAKYGQQALAGIRLALNRPEFEETITLHIQDTAGKTAQTIKAYQKLVSLDAEWVLGPLLSSSSEALLPYLEEDIPVIALSNQVNLASKSPSLFIHSLAKVVQAKFMAKYARNQDKQRLLVIHDYLDSAKEEAAAFSQAFINEGGEIIDVIELKEGEYDSRPSLTAMRSRTDDEELLARLDLELQLFSPEREMDIKLPLNFDAVYIATSGKKLSILAGQLAYSGISRVQLYGSYRWFDGHLMADEGRYLSSAQFATPVTSLSQPDQAILDVQNQYRVIWAQKSKITPLFALAYDAAMNSASLGTRLGFKGDDAIHALGYNTEFSGISGNYHFDEDGISQKNFAIQTIRRGRVEVMLTK